MQPLRGPILLVGCGKMGGALLDGWLAAGLPAGDAWIVEPARLTLPAGVHHVGTVGELPADLAPTVLLLAVKPQVMPSVAPSLIPWVTPSTLVLSIAAGKSIASFERLYGADKAVVRAMPNTPAAVGRGASVLCANAATGPAARDLAGRLMAAVGTVDWVEDEDLIHAVTAMSGGGPAYVFLLVETLAAAGVKAGLPADLAARLARTTVEGSGELARLSADVAPAQLRKNVTSPNGTTQAALSVLMAEDGMQPLMDRAIAAAAARSRELGREEGA